MRNALVCAAGRDSVNADMDRVIIAAPEWLNEDDHSAGAVQSNDVYFDNSSYQQGGPALGPGDVKLSSFEAYVEPAPTSSMSCGRSTWNSRLTYCRLDKLVSSFWNKSVYPELETVVIASHCTFDLCRPWVDGLCRALADYLQFYSTRRPNDSALYVQRPNISVPPSLST